MNTISSLIKKYRSKVDSLDLELIIARVLRKEREFVLAHPEKKITHRQETVIEKLIARRIDHEPLAYILGEKEFYGLKFKVDKNTLIPRPETELLVEEALEIIQSSLATPSLAKPEKFKVQNYIIVDVGTGSGNIIVSLAHNIKHGTWNNVEFYAIDNSRKALGVARRNAKLNRVAKNIKFIHGNLLESLTKKCSMLRAPCSILVVANLPYLSSEIYNSASAEVKKYEPKTALLSEEGGLAHYKKLLKQLRETKQKCSMFHVLCFMEISPEQKVPLVKLIKKLFPKAKPLFEKDLAGKWRICRLEL